MPQRSGQERDFSAKELMELGPVFRPRRAYQLRVGEIDFARVHIDPKGTVLAWPGELDFTQLEYTAVNTLSQRIIGLSPWSVQEIEDRNLIEAQLQSIKRGGRFSEFDLSDPDQYQRYQEVLGDPTQTGLAQYDVYTGGLKPPKLYSFAAENPALYQDKSDRKPELSIRLPRSRIWRPQVLAFVAESHSNADQLKEAIDYEPGSKFVNELTKPDNGHAVLRQSITAKYTQDIFDALSGHDDMVPYQRRADWSDVGAVLHAYGKTSGENRELFIKAMGEIVRLGNRFPEAATQVVSLISSLDIAQLAPEVEHLGKRNIKNPNLKEVINSFKSARRLRMTK